ncbi:hypothetical protein [Nitratidesulfovibrio vulgaris]|jgi:uncharacterized protein HemX|uniref:DUF2802 domain-containing protein n=1 Tax=Nitratidesulfovibrio vulgaris (strain ATCC 29579 / DSM 644 / CCUG 34227 / NCIMB 8303 / VKM B-1760 / Hildenborough) TaxID=882 RepID=Q725H1_NITV2|nr:hypothetical protein [Nitratidesulfovibrio vulgaris]AAS97695.1 hypothetical protein DVU_3225 [Nitratidesulfovibrio vulgaris str. Hildenborough]ADP88123.1 hypothetical protein Deval_2981 [Nitratidesulfovibrio vulgaris RCH1]WCB46615.1 hypothetical protein PH214_00580 [Nitratidesulfovibrio vulgaris]HBW15080.1 hypothetical protein [Desulfovibrio sp.]
MQLSLWTIALFSLAEVALLGLLLLFFVRLRRSETLLSRLQANQESLLERLRQNAELEAELVASFAQRQHELRRLDMELEERAATMEKLIRQAEEVSRSPHFLREVIVNGRRKGRTIEDLARVTGLARDEVEIILARAGER